jgi:hypothetical protein
MAQKSLYQLTLDINANSAKLSKGLAKANSSLGGTGKAASGLGKIMNNVFKEAAGYIDNMIPGFSSFTSGIKKMITGVNGFSGSLKIMKTALISTGIGAIVVAFGTLISYFKNTKSGADTFNKALGGIKAVITTLMKRINLLGEAVSLVLKGKFKEAAEKAKEAFSDVGDEVSKNYALGRELAERENALKKRQIEFIRKQADMERDIAEARLIASDKSKTEGERQKAIAKAIQLQKDLGAEKNAIAEEEYKVQSAINALGDNKYKDDEKEAELYAKMVGTQKEEADRLREMVAMQNEIATQAKTKAAAEEKALEALKAQNQAIEVQVGPIVKPLDTKTLAPMQMGEIKPPNLDVATQAWVDYKDGVMGIWEMIESQALTTFNKIKDTAVDVGGMLAGTLTDAVVGLAEAFGNLFAGTEAGFKGVVTAALQSIQQIINALLAQAIAGMIAGESKKGLVGLITGAIGISTLLALWKSKVPEFASGTNYAPGGLALVGERGPELVNLPRGAQVYNNNLTRGMMGGGEVRFIIEQDKLVGILSNANKKNIYF